MHTRAIPLAAITAALALQVLAGGPVLGQSLSPPGPAPGPAPAPAPIQAPPAPVQSPAPAPARPAQTAPSGLAPSMLGPLELTPLRAVLRIVPVQGSYLCVEPTLRFRLRNTGPADVRVAAIAATINVTDDLGLTLLSPDRRSMYVPNIIGVTALKDTTEWNRAAGAAGSQITTLAPGQTISIQFAQAARASGTNYCLTDTGGNFTRSYRPSNVTISATLATVDLSGAADLRPFSLFDVPVDLLRL